MRITCPPPPPTPQHPPAAAIKSASIPCCAAQNCCRKEPGRQRHTAALHLGRCGPARAPPGTAPAPPCPASTPPLTAADPPTPTRTRQQQRPQPLPPASTMPHLGQGDGFDGLVGVAARGGVALHCRLGAQRVQVNTHDALDGVDGRHTLTAWTRVCVGGGGEGRRQVRQPWRQLLHADSGAPVEGDFTTVHATQYRGG
jgi:hypothetical protein